MPAFHKNFIKRLIACLYEGFMDVLFEIYAPRYPIELQDDRPNQVSSALRVRAQEKVDMAGLDGSVAMNNRETSAESTTVLAAVLLQPGFAQVSRDEVHILPWASSVRPPDHQHALKANVDLVLVNDPDCWRLMR